MASRRDQLQSYQFLIQRMISAFVMRETDPAQSPLRRGIGAVFGGLMAAILVGAGFGVYGILTKVGGTDWKSDGSVVVERESGASFVYLSGRLNPTLNFASAVLASGKAGQVFRVPRKSLSSVPRGLTIGIVGAPDSLPPANQIVGMPWTLCSAAGTDSSGATVATVTLVAGSAPAGARTTGTGQGLLVKDATTGAIFLVANGYRHQIRDTRIVLPALFGAVVTPATVGTSWINGLPAGVAIGPIAVDGRGATSKGVPSRKVGDVLVAQTGSGPQYYLVLDDGVAVITELQKAILDAQFPTQPIPVSVAAAEGAKRSGRLPTGGGEAAPPEAPPKLDTQPTAPSEPVCARSNDAKSAPQISVGGTVASIEAGVPTIGRSSDGTSLADRVVVPAGRIAVVRVLPSIGATSGAYAIVTDAGLRYSVPGANVLQMLGYSPEQAVDVPASLVSRIPAGPLLDPAAALLPASSGATTAPQSPAPKASTASPTPSGSPTG
jgi:type VII secretion protein EccB